MICEIRDLLWEFRSLTEFPGEVRCLTWVNYYRFSTTRADLNCCHDLNLNFLLYFESCSHVLSGASLIPVHFTLFSHWFHLCLPLYKQHLSHSQFACRLPEMTLQPVTCLVEFCWFRIFASFWPASDPTLDCYKSNSALLALGPISSSGSWASGPVLSVYLFWTFLDRGLRIVTFCSLWLSVFLDVDFRLDLDCLIEYTVNGTVDRKIVGVRLPGSCVCVFPLCSLQWPCSICQTWWLPSFTPQTGPPSGDHLTPDCPTSCSALFTLHSISYP